MTPGINVNTTTIADDNVMSTTEADNENRPSKITFTTPEDDSGTVNQNYFN